MHESDDGFQFNIHLISLAPGAILGILVDTECSILLIFARQCNFIRTRTQKPCTVDLKDISSACNFLGLGRQNRGELKFCHRLCQKRNQFFVDKKLIKRYSQSLFMQQQQDQPFSCPFLGTQSFSYQCFYPVIYLVFLEKLSWTFLYF